MTLNSKMLGSTILVLVVLLFQSKEAHSQKTNSTFGMVIHGGAGTILKKNMSPELEQAYQSKLEEALQTGYNILKNNGSSMDAVEATIKILENSPLFNAGKGAVFTGDGTHELDASIMDGRTLQAGAVASVKHVKNPITLARLVLEKSPHVMMVGDGAEEFAVQHNLDRVSQYYFYTEKRWNSLQKRKEAAKEKTTGVPKNENIKLADKEKRHGRCRGFG